MQYKKNESTIFISNSQIKQIPQIYNRIIFYNQYVEKSSSIYIWTIWFYEKLYSKSEIHLIIFLIIK